MDPEKFNELLKILRFLKSADPGKFRMPSFVNLNEMAPSQRKILENEFGVRKKIWIDNPLYYNYYAESDSDF